MGTLRLCGALVRGGTRERWQPSRIEPVQRIHSDAAQAGRLQMCGVERRRVITDQQGATARAGPVQAGRMHQVGIEDQDVPGGP